MFEPVPFELALPIASIMGLASAWGIWRGRRTSRIAALVLLGVLLLNVATAYALYSHAATGPWAIIGGSSLLAALGLIGPSVFERRVLAIAISIAIYAAFIFAGGGAYLYAACILFAVCI